MRLREFPLKETYASCQMKTQARAAKVASKAVKVVSKAAAGNRSLVSSRSPERLVSKAAADNKNLDSSKAAKVASRTSRRRSPVKPYHFARRRETIPAGGNLEDVYRN